MVCVPFQSEFISLQASVLLRLLNLVRSSLYFIAASFTEVLSFILSYFFYYLKMRALKIVKLSFFFFCDQIVKISPFPPHAVFPNTR